MRTDLMVTYEDQIFDIEAMRIFNKASYDKGYGYLIKIANTALKEGKPYCKKVKVLQINIADKVSFSLLDSDKAIVLVPFGLDDAMAMETG